jgi:Zn-finger nucleic acid-binding protein
VTDSYVCPNCERVEDRSYRVRLILLTCPECGNNGRFLNRTLVDRLREVPESDRPDDWGEMPLDVRLEYAIREGLLDVSFTGPLRVE